MTYARLRDRVDGMEVMGNDGIPGYPRQAGGRRLEQLPASEGAANRQRNDPEDPGRAVCVDGNNRQDMRAARLPAERYHAACKGLEGRGISPALFFVIVSLGVGAAVAGVPDLAIVAHLPVVSQKLAELAHVHLIALPGARGISFKVLFKALHRLLFRSNN